MTPAELEVLFRASAGPAVVCDDLGGEVFAYLAAGRAAWPGLALDDETFARHLAEHAGNADGRALPPREHAADFYLACACAAGVSGAAAAFDRAFRSTLERAVARIDPAVDEATQIALVSLLVATPDARPRIAGYSGRSSLRAWLTTVAARAAFKLHRRRGDQAHDTPGGLAAALVADEPELALAKARHGPQLEASLRTALASLEPRQLVLLRLHHGKGWSVDRLGALYDIGRSTAARWVAAARESLVETARRDLRVRLNLTPSELESLIALLQSNIQVSLLRLLDEEQAEKSDDPALRRPG
jgi:RNA polymerase sigma-70 factor (ECF subfamily)